ncbi:MAG: GTP-binding protein [Clostridia bacterium]|nr:GTP-binding protein [Clostridia bacterium]
MTKIDIFSGFLGAGKTTLIKKLIQEAYTGEKLVLIENEFGEIGIDGGFMKEAGIEITEMNSGCICCSLVGDFTQSLGQVLEQFSPDRILIEPSGVGKLSDVIKAVQKVESADVKLNSFTTVADAGKCKVYARNFGEFYNDQVEHAGCIILSRTDGVSHEKLDAAVALLREKNPQATIITTPWSQLTGGQILAAMEQQSTLAAELSHLAENSCPVCGHPHEHEHHHHHDGEECHCHDHDHEHEHHHHHDGEECHCHDHDHEHEHHHHHDDEECHCHDHDHHHHHHADDVFDSWGVETVTVYSQEEIQHALEQLDDQDRFGMVLRAKGIVAGGDGWIHFDYVPGAPDVRQGGADVTGRLCVIGADIQKPELAALFRIEL